MDQKEKTPEPRGKIPLKSHYVKNDPKLFPNNELLQRLATFAAVFVSLPYHWILWSVLLTSYILCFGGWLSRALLVVYFIWSQVDHTRGQGIGYPALAWTVDIFTRSSVMKLAAQYYPFSVHKTAELPEDGKYIFCCHPHGVFGLTSGYGFTASYAAGIGELFPDSITGKMRFVGLDMLFRIPFMREYCLMVGLGSSHRNTFGRMLAKGEHVCVNLGGAAESLGIVGENQKSGKMKLILKERKGFVKIALQQGATLVPCVAFNENLAFHVLEDPRLTRIQLLLQKKVGVWHAAFCGALAVLDDAAPQRNESVFRRTDQLRQDRKSNSGTGRRKAYRILPETNVPIR